MEGGSWRPAGQGDTGGEPPAGDWRSQLQPESRQGIVNKIMETLQRHLPIAASEGLTELKTIAVRFEEKIYTAATSQADYLQKISLKMLSMETKTQNPQAINPSSMNPAVGNQSNVDTGSEGRELQDALETVTGQFTVPSVYIEEPYEVGCTVTLDLSKESSEQS